MYPETQVAKARIEAIFDRLAAFTNRDAVFTIDPATLLLWLLGDYHSDLLDDIEWWMGENEAEQDAWEAATPPPIQVSSDRPVEHPFLEVS